MSHNEANSGQNRETSRGKAWKNTESFDADLRQLSPTSSAGGVHLLLFIEVAAVGWTSPVEERDPVERATLASFYYLISAMATAEGPHHP